MKKTSMEAVKREDWIALSERAPTIEDAGSICLITDGYDVALAMPFFPKGAMRSHRRLRTLTMHWRICATRTEPVTEPSFTPTHWIPFSAQLPRIE